MQVLNALMAVDRKARVTNKAVALFEAAVYAAGSAFFTFLRIACSVARSSSVNLSRPG
jgi:hypothetical protein